jgi:hypothetical protein
MPVAYRGVYTIQRERTDVLVRRWCWPALGSLLVILGVTIALKLAPGRFAVFRSPLPPSRPTAPLPAPLDNARSNLVYETACSIVRKHLKSPEAQINPVAPIQKPVSQISSNYWSVLGMIETSTSRRIPTIRDWQVLLREEASGGLHPVYVRVGDQVQIDERLSAHPEPTKAPYPQKSSRHVQLGLLSDMQIVRQDDGQFVLLHARSNH